MTSWLDTKLGWCEVFVVDPDLGVLVCTLRLNHDGAHYDFGRKIHFH